MTLPGLVPGFLAVLITIKLRVAQNSVWGPAKAGEGGLEVGKMGSEGEDESGGKKKGGGGSEKGKKKKRKEKSIHSRKREQKRNCFLWLQLDALMGAERSRAGSQHCPLPSRAGTGEGRTGHGGVRPHLS